MYHWLIFVHVLSVFGFLLGHGASAATAWKLRAERWPEHVQAQVELLNGCGKRRPGPGDCVGHRGWLHGGFWGRGWIWAALGVLVLLSVLMMMLGTSSYARIRSALGQIPSATAAVELRSVHPALMTTIAAVGLGVLLWLMMFKPF